MHACLSLSTDPKGNSCMPYYNIIITTILARLAIILLLLAISIDVTVAKYRTVSKRSP